MGRSLSTQLVLCAAASLVALAIACSNKATSLGIWGSADSGASPGASAAAGDAGSAGGNSRSDSGSRSDGGMPSTAPADAGMPSQAGRPADGGGTTLIGDAAPAIMCTQAANAYTVSSITLDPSLTPHSVSQAFGSDDFSHVPVAVDPATGNVYVAFAHDADGGVSAIIVSGTNGANAPVVSASNATLGGVAVTSNGFALLEFDPNDNVDNRMWAAVERFDTSGTALFSTDLFRSADLTDAGTRGAPSTSRFAYLPSSDELVAYFAHTQMIQGVRHQGGYVATVSAGGTQTLVSGWWGSHNLDQRLLVSGSQVALLGLGDAYPKGIFFALLANNPPTQVIYTVAGDGQGTANAQLGGMVDLDDVIFVPFITNDSISQTLTPGNWPNIDQTIASQIDTAAGNGNKLGFLLVPKSGSPPSGDLPPVWLDPMLSSGAHLERLKSARYGSGQLVLLAWSETSGTSSSKGPFGNPTRNYFTMVVDRTGAVCQPKTPLGASYALTGGDDFVRRADGSIVWANIINNEISIVTLNPG